MYCSNPEVPCAKFTAAAFRAVALPEVHCQSTLSVSLQMTHDSLSALAGTSKQPLT